MKKKLKNIIGNNFKIAFIIPAHNEERVIAHTIMSLNKFSKSKDIYVVNDGSTDSTKDIAKQLGVNILNIYPNKGKANALNSAILYFNLITKYDYIMPVDADTEVLPSYFKFIIEKYNNDTGKHIVAVVGRVVSRVNTWVTAYRAWEYEVAQTIHKAAQDKENAVAVCPGCSTVFRSEIFNKLKIPTTTLTEDMDFTFAIHRKKLGKVVFEEKAVVVTQDPQNLKDYLKQVDRWYTGFWQCVIKHNIPWKGQMLDMEVGLLALDGLFSGLIAVIFLIFSIVLAEKSPLYLITFFAIDFFVFMLPTILYTLKKYRNALIFNSMFYFYIIRILSSLIFLKSFIKIVLGIDLNMVWGKATRYSIKKEKTWLNLSPR